jgi:hypothetical protein
MRIQPLTCDSVAIDPSGDERKKLSLNGSVRATDDMWPFGPMSHRGAGG